MLQPWIPLTAKPLWLFGILTVLLILFDLVLVRWLKLNKVAWKRVDYIWLSVAAIGLYGTAAEVRRLTAEESLPMRKEIREAAYDRVIDSVRLSTGGAVCRKFVRTDLSPPNFDEIVREFDSACKFTTTLAGAIPPKAPEKLDTTIFKRRPVVTDEGLKEQFGWIDSSLSDYFLADAAYRETERAKRRSDIDLAYSVGAPLLLIIALALRITKVTGEIRLDRAAAEPSAAHDGLQADTPISGDSDGKSKGLEDSARST
jgi:hypothetical protein